MNQIIPLKFIGIIAFIMIFTYTATGILYSDYESEIDISDFNKDVSHTTTIGGFMQIQWEYAQEELINGKDMHDEKFYAYDTQTHIYNAWINRDSLFDIYSSGLDFLEHHPMFDGWNNWKRNNVDDDFHDYLNKVGYEPSGDKGMLDTIGDFFSAIPNALGRIYDVMSFNIPKIPAHIRALLSIIFIPLWIILTIGIAPLVIKALQAVASFADAIIPF